MEAVLWVWVIVIVVPEPKVAIRALVVEAVSSDFPVHVSYLTSAVLARVLRPNTEAHLPHEENHVSLRQQEVKKEIDNSPGIRETKRRMDFNYHKNDELEAL